MNFIDVLLVTMLIAMCNSQAIEEEDNVANMSKEQMENKSKFFALAQCQKSFSPEESRWMENYDAGRKRCIEEEYVS